MAIENNTAVTQPVTTTAQPAELPKTPITVAVEPKPELPIKEYEIAKPEVETQPDYGSSWANAVMGRVGKPKPPRTLHAFTDENKKAFVVTDDNWTITFPGENQKLEVISPEGRKTIIWGDPHVIESDGDKWDFHKNSTFVFGNNKITIETAEKSPGVSYSKTVSIYNGNDRFTITDLNIDRPKFVAWARDGETHDASLKDGDIYKLSFEKNGDDQWKKIN